MFPMNETALVERSKPVEGSGGSIVDSFSSHLTDVPCRFQEGVPKDIRGQAAEKADIVGVAYFSGGTDIQRGDRVTIRGITGLVLGGSSPSVSSVYLKVLLESEQATVFNGPS